MHMSKPMEPRPDVQRAAVQYSPTRGSCAPTVWPAAGDIAARGAALRNFLRACRARLFPEDVGLSIGRRRQTRGRVPEVTEKREGLSEEDVQDWLKEFAGLEDEPGLKELFDPYGFNEEQ